MTSGRSSRKTQQHKEEHQEQQQAAVPRISEQERNPKLGAAVSVASVEAAKCMRCVIKVAGKKEKHTEL